MKETIAISVDYESPSAYRVARDIWSALSRTALDSGFAGITARWESLHALEEPSSLEVPAVFIFVLGQDRPEAVEQIEIPGNPGTRATPLSYGVVVATPGSPNPLAGSLLYQGVARLTGGGVKAGAILPALIPVSPKIEGEAYAAKLFQGVRKTQTHR